MKMIRGGPASEAHGGAAGVLGHHIDPELTDMLGGGGRSAKALLPAVPPQPTVNICRGAPASPGCCPSNQTGSTPGG